MNEWTVEISSPAEADINGIYTYIAETLLEPVTALRQADRIYEAIFTLEEMPERCPLLADEPWRSRGLRRLIVDSYSVIYEVQEAINTVSVAAVIYSKRDISAVSFEF